VAILSFWSDDQKDNGQTLSIVAIATYMSVEHNYRTLVIDASLNDDTMERCFWSTKNKDPIKSILNHGKIDVSAGTNGLMMALASNKITPESISSYTNVVYNKRLDILLGLKNQTYQEYEKIFPLYKDLVLIANRYYDMIFVDLPKGRKAKEIAGVLKVSDLVMYTMSQNLKQIDYYKDNKKEMMQFTKKIVPFLNNVDISCKYNPKNVASYLKEKNLGYILYNATFLEAASEAQVSDFFLRTRLSKKTFDENYKFIETLSETSKKIINKLENQKYGRI